MIEKFQILVDSLTEAKEEKKNPIIYLNNDFVSLQFWGWEIVLLPNGKYYINDTTGG